MEECIMIRTFSEHMIRPTKELSGDWDFITDPENKGVNEAWFEHFPTPEARMYVPSCWNNELGFYEYEGVAWYRTTFHLEQEQHIKLIFHAVLGHADVYLDGEHLGYHYGGYSPFSFVVKQATAGRHELIVRTDSQLTRQTIPIELVDWFHYGGIIRPVELQELSDVYIERLNVHYELHNGDAEVTYQVKLQSLSSEDHEVPLCLLQDESTIHTKEILVKAGEAVSYEVKQTWSKVRLWNVGQPELYMVGAAISEDDIYDRIGFRKIEVINKEICINNSPVYLQGVNRHEEHPEWGFAFPPKLMRKDLAIILDMGCNAVRGSHYPQSKYWIDLLDEEGFLFWSEIPMWGALMPKEVTADPLFQERALQMVDEMIERDIHHPSIIFWSVHNEIDTTCEEGLQISEKLVNLVRSKDSSRLVSYATMHPLHDIVMPLFDIIGINKYFGWYEGEVGGFKKMLDQFHERAEQLGAGDRPILLTEFGGAGIYGDTGWEPRLFSEDYQSYIVTEALKIFRADSNVQGTFVWQFADVRADTSLSRNAFRDRARSFNNKGLLNEYRKPKQAFREVRSIYRSGEK